MNVLILAAGEQLIDQQGDYPLCLMEIDGVPLLQRVAGALASLSPSRIIIALRDDEIRRFYLDEVASLVVPNAHLVPVMDRTQGAACTALLAVGLINSDQELLIINSNDLIDADFSSVIRHFRDRGLDGGAIVFSSIHPRYSYLRLDEEGYVIEAAEKKPISRHATTGFYWFANGRDFCTAAMSMIRKNANVNGNFYICPVFNELILRQKKIGTFPIEAKQYFPLKNEQQIGQFESAVERGLF